MESLCTSPVLVYDIFFDKELFLQTKSIEFEDAVGYNARCNVKCYIVELWYERDPMVFFVFYF